jgi:hypothetical protein
VEKYTFVIIDNLTEEQVDIIFKKDLEIAIKDM